jgi:hypothetical protein
MIFSTLFCVFVSNYLIVIKIKIIKKLIKHYNATTHVQKIYHVLNDIKNKAMHIIDPVTMPDWAPKDVHHSTIKIDPA